MPCGVLNHELNMFRRIDDPVEGTSQMKSCKVAADASLILLNSRKRHFSGNVRR